MKTKTESELARLLRLELGRESFLYAAELKKKFRARTWRGLLLKLIELGRNSPELMRKELTRSERIAKEISSSVDELQAYLEDLMRPYEKTAIEDALNPESAARIVHTGKVVKVLLQMMKKDIETSQKKI